MLRARGRQSARHLLGTASSAKLAELADREVQILELVGAGRTSVAIARAPDVSPRMIAKHLEHIYRKPGVSGRRGPRHASTCSGHQKDRIAKRGVRPRAFLRSGRAPLPIYCCTEALSLRLPGSRCGDARRSARLRAEPGLAEGVVRAAE
jgi:DNA-binding CsgD family transcriptional regulator